MKHRHAIVSALSLVLLTACSTAAQQEAASPSASDVVVTVGDTRITLAEIDKDALELPASNFGSLPLSQALYEARRAIAEQRIGNMLIEAEAKRRSMEPSALFEQEVTSKVASVTDADISTWYQANPQRVQGAPLEQVSGPIRQLLTQERVQAARETYLSTLKVRTPVRLMLEPPRADVSAGNSPVKGRADAPVEIIEFADFECPFCRAAAPTVKRVLDTYGDKVRLVYRNYPLSNHPHAQPAAEAAQCANEQGQFWAYHDRLFGNPDKLNPADLKQAAVELGLDAARFNTCFDERRYQSVVAADAEAGSNAGVSGTPAFFINGRPLSGAQPFEAFKQIIDDELSRRAQ